MNTNPLVEETSPQKTITQPSTLSDAVVKIIAGAATIATLAGATADLKGFQWMAPGAIAGGMIGVGVKVYSGNSLATRDIFMPVLLGAGAGFVYSQYQLMSENKKRVIFRN